MGFIPPWLSQLIGDSQFDACVERITRDIEDIAWNRTHQLVVGMSTAEARGYIRARTVLLINQRIGQESAATYSPQYRNRLVSSVQDQLTDAMFARIHNSSGLTTVRDEPLRRAA